MKTAFFSIFILFFLIFGKVSSVFSQETTQGHLYTMTMLMVPSDKMNEFLKFYETDGKGLDAQNEHILSTKIFVHAWGPAWTICLMTEYKDWDGFHAADKRSTEIFNAAYPDQSKRDEIGKKWSSYLTGHTDAIVFDNPNLQK